MTTYLYAALAGDDKLSIFTLAPDTGALTHQHDVQQADQPSPLAVDPAKQFCFVGLRRPGAFGLASFRIEAQTGDLIPLGSISVDGDPVYLATDHTGQYLLSAYYYQRSVAVHAIGEYGRLNPTPIEWRQTDIGAHAIEADASNQFVFVPHIGPGGALDGPNAIFQFQFDDRTGHLAPNDPATVTPPGPDGPRHICFHPTLDVIYSSNEQGCGVTAYHLDKTSGTLAPFQTVSTLPADFAGRNTCSQIRITPDGRFLYAPNRGHNSIAGFNVDPATGQLTAIGHTPTDAVPRAFNLDPQGHFLFASGLETGRLLSFRIAAETGQLDPLDSYDIGKQPMWILCLER
jgi:6-phosphogluconolactonase